jgi:c-di-AMP phosphodiesterase-like protein
MVSLKVFFFPPFLVVNVCANILIYLGYTEFHLVQAIFTLVFFQNLTGNTIQQYIDNIKQLYHTQQVKESFRNALNLIPNGVIMINLHSLEIDFANKELFELVGTQKDDKQIPWSYKDLKVKLSNFFSS